MSCTRKWNIWRRGSQFWRCSILSWTGATRQRCIEAPREAAVVVHLPLDWPQEHHYDLSGLLMRGFFFFFAFIRKPGWLACCSHVRKRKCRSGLPSGEWYMNYTKLLTLFFDFSLTSFSWYFSAHSSADHNFTAGINKTVFGTVLFCGFCVFFFFEEQREFTLLIHGYKCMSFKFPTFVVSTSGPFFFFFKGK